MTESTAVLRLAQAARTLGIESRELARLVYERRIGFVMIDGIAHIPSAALEDLRAQGGE